MDTVAHTFFPSVFIVNVCLFVVVVFVLLAPLLSHAYSSCEYLFSTQTQRMKVGPVSDGMCALYNSILLFYDTVNSPFILFFVYLCI